MQYTLRPSDVHKLAAEVLTEHLELTDSNRTCPARTLLTLVFAACARLCSLTAAAAGLSKAPSPETVRTSLLANLPPIELLQRRLNRALRATTPRRLGQQQRLAIDLTLIPYHGTHDQHENELYRGQVKSGTTHFHAYATAYLIQHGQRVTLALTYVRHPKGPGGTRVFDYWKRGGFGTHTLSRSGGKTACVGIVVHCRNRAGRRGKHGRERLVYASWGWSPSNPAQVSELYRSRFGIETGYRQMNQCRARTCTRKPSVRLFLVGVALVLRNVWVWLHWEVLSGVRRGRRSLRLELLPLKTLLLMLLEVAAELFDFTDAIQTQRPIPDRLGA